ncbi:MAG TPA: hypothetical protein VK466_17230, partial [Terriglobales bacterium]|nr:hypothetical protein [Terriglobales bacterium]
DRERGGFYASQDADYSMDDDGDYFTWTLAEVKAVLTAEEAEVAALHFDINEIGEMHHNSAKNVLYVRASLEEIARRLQKSPQAVKELLNSAKKKMYAARLERPAPYVDKTVYVGWNGLCISAYLQAANVLGLPEARRFALRSLDRVLAEAWRRERGLLHVVAYSDSDAARREVRGLLDDYAFTAIACLDAYEVTADLSYFRFAQSIADAMVEKFFDPVGSGFLDAEAGTADGGKTLGVLASRRKPFQDSPTPAGNSVAAIALVRLHAYTNDESYRDKAELTLEVFAGTAEQFGIFGSTYGIAAVYFSQPHTQVVVIGEGDEAEDLRRAALGAFTFNKAVIQIAASELVAANLPPALAETLPNLPKSRQACAVICSGGSCQAPVYEAAQLDKLLRATRPAA